MSERFGYTPDYEVKKQMLENLVSGLQNKEDPIAWRSLIVDIRSVLGSAVPEFTPPPIETFDKGKVLIGKLIKGTCVEELNNEILWACYENDKALPSPDSVKPLDVLLINGRYQTRELFWSFADSLKAQGKSVAVINPVGHFADGQTRVVAPSFLIRPVKEAIFFSSTQSADGGELSVLDLTLRALRNPKFAFMIDKVRVVTPLFGGSRGHRPGQSEGVGFEVLETIYNPKQLIETIDDVRHCSVRHNSKPLPEYLHQIRGKHPRFPYVDFWTVDIHNEELPGEKFYEAQYNFTSISPAKEHAQKIVEVVAEKKYDKLVKAVVACDAGSIERTEDLAKELFNLGEKNLLFIYIDKERIRAGEVESVKINRIEKWNKNEKGELVKEKIKESQAFDLPCILIFSDDMIDTGRTAKNDIASVKEKFPNSKYTIFAATHPIFSKGIGEALNRIGADIYLIGNTLGVKPLKNYDNVKIVDVAPAIARAISEK